VLTKACQDAVLLPDNVKIAINLSPAQFKSSALPMAVATALAQAGISPKRIELEITESVLLSNTEENGAILKQLRHLGVSIALDDFGTGYSSLSYLQSFPFDKIKIDRSFTQNMLESAECAAIVKAMIDLTRSLNMVNTAEGVETEEQHVALRKLGCAQLQGYHFSKPKRLTDILKDMAEPLRAVA
jgi:EAL domain-containing protein (putative c-di-GMP-specific phosphodiesterase class I)